MSDTVKVGDVIALPVRINEPTFIDDAGDSPLAKVRREDQAAAIALAINNHDRLQEENGRMRAALERIANGEHDECRPVNFIANEFMEIADAALQACDAQQEPRNGTV